MLHFNLFAGKINKSKPTNKSLFNQDYLCTPINAVNATSSLMDAVDATLSINTNTVFTDSIEKSESLHGKLCNVIYLFGFVASLFMSLIYNSHQLDYISFIYKCTNYMCYITITDHENNPKESETAARIQIHIDMPSTIEEKNITCEVVAGGKQKSVLIKWF